VAKDMPPNPGPITDKEQQTIKAWIEAGAPEWDGPAGAQKTREFISVRKTLSTILNDLNESDKDDRPYQLDGWGWRR
jgi:hypothetical protein